MCQGRLVFLAEHLPEALFLLPRGFRSSYSTGPTLDFRYRISDTLSVQTLVRLNLKGNH
jgi:hypothetical protein